MFLLLIPAASASSVYPTDLVTALELPCAPTCIVCHDTNGGGDGTVIQDFGLALMDRGLTGASASERLGTALEAMDADNVDSDGDGTTDTEELVAGHDPNPGGGAFCSVVTPEYGCSTAGDGAPASFLAMVLSVGLACRRPRGAERAQSSMRARGGVGG